MEIFAAGNAVYSTQTKSMKSNDQLIHKQLLLTHKFSFLLTLVLHFSPHRKLDFITPKYPITSYTAKPYIQNKVKGDKMAFGGSWH